MQTSYTQRFDLVPPIRMVEYDPFIKSTCLMQLTLGPYVVQIWSRYSRNFESTQPSYSTVRMTANETMSQI